MRQRRAPWRQWLLEDTELARQWEAYAHLLDDPSFVWQGPVSGPESLSVAAPRGGSTRFYLEDRIDLTFSSTGFPGAYFFSSFSIVSLM